jgi:IS30 family transposase
VYSCERAQLDYDLQATAKGYGLKLSNCYALVKFISGKVKAGYSPDVISSLLRKAPNLPLLCTKTIYNYIDAGLIAEITNESLLEKRTTLYYADPYCSWQRGTNENTNRIIRRFVAKGRDIARFTKKAVRQFTEWINCYPRKILNYDTPAELFEAFVQA